MADIAPDFGVIVCARVKDPQGRNEKRRTVMIVSTADEIARQGFADVVAVSGSYEQAEADHCVMLPYLNGRRHPKTGLDRKCAAICSWIDQIKVEKIEEVRGRLTGTPLLKVVEKIASLGGK